MGLSVLFLHHLMPFPKRHELPGSYGSEQSTTRFSEEYTCTLVGYAVASTCPHLDGASSSDRTSSTRTRCDFCGFISGDQACDARTSDNVHWASNSSDSCCFRSTRLLLHRWTFWIRSSLSNTATREHKQVPMSHFELDKRRLRGCSPKGMLQENNQENKQFIFPRCRELPVTT